MEEDIVTLVFLGIVCVGAAGYFIATDKFFSFLGAVILGTSVMVIVFLKTNDYFGPLKELDGKTVFVVRGAVAHGEGNDAMILYDMEKKKNLLAEFETYPPAGYQSVVTDDGNILLVPTAGHRLMPSSKGLVVAPSRE